MKGKIRLFRKALGLVWDSAPGWATANILISVLQSILPLVLIWLIKLLIDGITGAAQSGSGAAGIVPLAIAVVVVYFLDEICTDSGIIFPVTSRLSSRATCTTCFIPRHEGST
ncbi:MAG: hypothetical protein IPI69_15690 [Bacteroidales bacterium]|nr:hypothetical protein [Bacteroidales bacterium]